jgi:hypothetical protein
MVQTPWLFFCLEFLSRCREAAGAKETPFTDFKGRRAQLPEYDSRET